ncbi:MAG: DUF2461 domain-containing protein [Bacillota bacterium]|nr:DUF2461 domain-containing protein [Bacillota bacterium]
MGKVFEGFYQGTFDFLLSIGLNNNKAFFEANRPDFARYVQEPLLLLAARLEPLMQKIDDTLVTLPSRAISRIRRDTRFSNDKSPYRDHMWLAYRHEGESLGEGCGYYFELTPFGYGFGMGMYGPQKERMDKLRQAMLAYPKSFLDTIDKPELKSFFSLKGEDYKKKLPDEEKLPGQLKQLYRKRSFYYEHSQGIVEKALSPGIADDVEKGFLLLAPVYRLIQKISA